MGRAFTGTQYLNIDAVRFTNPGSLAFQWKPTWAQTDNAGHLPCFWYVSATYQAGIWKWTNNSIYAGWFTNNVDYRIVVATSSYTLTQNAWNSLVMTWGPAGATLYLNGRLIGSHTTAVNIFTPTYGTIGAYREQASSSTYCSESSLAEFAIWSSVLSAKDASDLRLVRPIDITPQPYAYWPFGGSFPQSDKDYSSRQSYPATAYNTPTWTTHPYLSRRVPGVFAAIVGYATSLVLKTGASLSVASSVKSGTSSLVTVHAASAAASFITSATSSVVTSHASSVCTDAVASGTSTGYTTHASSAQSTAVQSGTSSTFHASATSADALLVKDAITYTFSSQERTAAQASITSGSSVTARSSAASHLATVVCDGSQLSVNTPSASYNAPPLISDATATTLRMPSVTTTSHLAFYIADAFGITVHSHASSADHTFLTDETDLSVTKAIRAYLHCVLDAVQEPTASQSLVWELDIVFSLQVSADLSYTVQADADLQPSIQETTELELP